MELAGYLTACVDAYEADQPFGNSTAYRENMEAWLDWCPNTWCF